jgi:DNA-binding MarR family transcriptional regulator
MTDESDEVDSVIAGWRAVLPLLDPTPLGSVGRVLVLAQHLEQSVNKSLANHGLTLGEFDILGTLRRHGDAGMTPTQLRRWVILTSGGMTARLTRLEERGLLVRRQDTEDRRVVIVELTESGRKLVDVAAATRFQEAYESRPRLNPESLEQLENQLRTWLRQFGDDARPADFPPL